MKQSKTTLHTIILSIFTIFLALNTAEAVKDTSPRHYNIIIKAQDLHTPYVRYSIEKILSESSLIKTYEILVKSQKIKIKTTLYKDKKSELEEEIQSLLSLHKFTFKEVKAYKIR